MNHILYIVVFNLMIQFSIEMDNRYRSYSFKLFEDNLSEYNGQDNVRKKSKHLALADTANIIANIPVYSLMNPEAYDEGKYNYDKLNDLIDFYKDYESQYVIVKKEDRYIVMISTIGLSKRWSEYTKERSLSGNLIDAKIIPPDRIHWLENYNFKYKFFSVDKFQEYLELNSGLDVFIIYKMDGLFCVKNDQLIRLNFTREGIEEMDGEVYYQENIINNGVEKIKDIIIGGDPFWIK